MVAGTGSFGKKNQKKVTLMTESVPLKKKKTCMTMENPPFEGVFFPLKMGIFQCHVSFQGCKSISFEILVKATLTESNRPLAKQMEAH